MGERLVLFEVCPVDEGGGKRCYQQRPPPYGHPNSQGRGPSWLMVVPVGCAPVG